jgi:hypothetical protein
MQRNVADLIKKSGNFGTRIRVFDEYEKSENFLFPRELKNQAWNKSGEELLPILLIAQIIKASCPNSNRVKGINPKTTPIPEKIRIPDTIPNTPMI